MKNASRTRNRTWDSHIEVPDLNNLATSPVEYLLVSVHEYSTSIHNYKSYNTDTTLYTLYKAVSLCNDVGPICNLRINSYIPRKVLHLRFKLEGE